MSPPILRTPSSSLPFNLQNKPILSPEGQSRDDLAARIEQQRSKIRALELAAEERRRSDQLRIREQAQTAESRRQGFRQQRLSTPISTGDGHVLSLQQDEHRRRGRQARNESAMKALFRYKAS